MPATRHSRRLRSYGTLLALLGLAGLQWGCAASQRLSPNQFAITGDISDVRRWTADEFRAEFSAELVEATATSKGREVRFLGVPLLKVVERATPRVDPNRKNAGLALTVVVEARDGYAAAFSLGELREDYGAASAFIAVEIDGVAPPADRGPVELVVPGDRRASRWVYAVETIRVVNLGALR